jgi:hypothetical protein
MHGNGGSTRQGEARGSGYRPAKGGDAGAGEERKNELVFGESPKKKTCLRASPVHGMTMSTTGFPTTALPVSGPRVGPCPSQPCGSPSQKNSMSRRHVLVKNDLWIRVLCKGLFLSANIQLPDGHGKRFWTFNREGRKKTRFIICCPLTCRGMARFWFIWHFKATGFNWLARTTFALSL